MSVADRMNWSAQRVARSTESERRAYSHLRVFSEQIALQQWRDRARCKGMDPEIFYVGRGENVKLRDAIAICMECPVREECGEYAIGHAEEHGVWGGMAERVRRRIRAQRYREARMVS